MKFRTMSFTIKASSRSVVSRVPVCRDQANMNAPDAGGGKNPRSVSAACTFRVGEERVGATWGRPGRGLGDLGFGLRSGCGPVGVRHVWRASYRTYAPLRSSPNIAKTQACRAALGFP